MSSLLLLAAGAEEGSALAERQHTDGRSAYLARFARAPVCIELLVEVTRRTVGREEVAQCRAATRDGVGEDAFHFGGELRIAFARHLACRSAWIDAGGEQGFARVDIADADDHGVVHQ